jgi:hypothetical protein
LNSCTSRCGLNEAKIGEEKAKIVHGWFEQGLNDQKIGQASFELGLDLSKSAIGRHRQKHLQGLEEITEANPVKEKIQDLDALEMILQQGASQIENWKVTPSDYFKALDMKYKLTQGSAFQGMLEALAVADEDEDEPGEEETADEGPSESEEPESSGLPRAVQGEPPL